MGDKTNNKIIDDGSRHFMFTKFTDFCTLFTNRLIFDMRNQSHKLFIAKSLRKYNLSVGNVVNVIYFAAFFGRCMK